MMRVRLEIQDITVLTAESSKSQLALSTKLLSTVTGVDERIARMEEILQQQARQLQASQFAQVGSQYARQHRARSRKPDTNTTAVGAADGIGVRFRPYVIACRPGCPCVCHSPWRSSTPGALNAVLGRLFVAYAGLPALGRPCDKPECQGSHASQISMEYWFPMNIWSTIVRVQLGYHANAGPSLQLETLRRVPDAAQCVEYAVHGNITGLQHLFKLGMASPRDISSGRGYSLLRWALYAKQYETCEFLVHAGADPDYRPISALDNSPRIKACHFLLEGSLSQPALDALRVITKGSDYLDDYIDDSKFTKLHKIVLGLSLEDLGECIASRPDEIDAQDAMGRTALAWAAARGDRRSVGTLLASHANPNIIDAQISGPLSNAAAQGHTACVELLLQYGADPDPPRPDGVRKGNPLNVASRNSKDIMILKRLLDFGADVNQTTAEGKTPLFHAARNDNAAFALLLLDNRADINAMSTSRETPLTTAITFNSHNVLRLLLERWHEYATCPRLQGPNLLETAALYADCETLGILAATRHFRTKKDQKYTLGDFKTILRQRADETEELVSAFDELLAVMNAAPDLHHGPESLLEAGFLRCLGSRTNTFEDGFARQQISDDESEENFQDAVEEQGDHELSGREVEERT